MYLITSPTVCSFSASSSGTSTENSSSKAITNSTISSESAPKSSMNDAVGVTCSGLTPSCSTMMSLTFSSIGLSAIKFLGWSATLTPRAAAPQVKQLPILCNQIWAVAIPLSLLPASLGYQRIVPDSSVDLVDLVDLKM